MPKANHSQENTGARGELLKEEEDTKTAKEERSAPARVGPLGERLLQSQQPNTSSTSEQPLYDGT